MAFLRLGTMCAVTNTEGEVLLSRRGDLGVWNLPGGRLDSGEVITTAALREVHEETGIVAQAEQVVGLYYWQGWDRLNVLVRGVAVGGELRQRTDETTANRFFPLADIPDPISARLAHDALNAGAPVCHTLITPPAQQRRIRWALRRRYVVNLLSRRPEPRFVRFDVRAVAVIWDELRHRVLTVPSEPLISRLPQVVCNGTRAPWDQLASACRAHLTRPPELAWIGLCQRPASDHVSLIFSATAPEDTLIGAAQWHNPQNTPLDGLESEYVSRCARAQGAAGVWTLVI